MAAFLTLLGNKDLVTSHEARVAQTARIMAVSGWPWDAAPVNVPIMHLAEIDGIKSLRADQSGAQMRVNPWLVPVINDQLRLQKPPLPYWCAAIVFRWFGVGEWQARFVPAMLGAIATLLIWDLAGMWLGRRAGIIAAGVWLSTHFVVDEHRKAMADPYLAFCTLACVWAWARACAFSGPACGARLGTEKRAPQAGPLNGALVVSFYFALALGAIAKGPVIFITVAIALIAFHICHRRRVGSWQAHLIGIALFLVVTLPWPIYILQHVPNATTIWRYESVGEMTGENVEKARPWWMYIGNSFQLPLPWTPFWIGGFVVAFVHGKRGLRSPRGKRRAIAILWQVMTVIFFSFLGVKKPAYLLPAMPAQTLITADAIVMMLAFARRVGTAHQPAKEVGNAHPTKLPTIAALAQALIGFGFSVGMTVLLVRGTPDHSLGIFAGAIAIVAAVLPFISIAKHWAFTWFPMQVIAYVVILIVLLGLQQPDDQNHRSSRRFAAALTQYLHDSHLPLMVHALPEDLAFYLPLDLPEADDLPHALLAVDHSPKDPPENSQVLSQILGDATVLDARQIELPGIDNQGRWRLFDVTLLRSENRI